MEERPDLTRRRLLASVPLSALGLVGAASVIDSCAVPGTYDAPVPRRTIGGGKAVSVREADAQYAFNDWQRWPIPEMPDLPLAPWDGVPGSFWKQSIANAAVDRSRTAQLPSVDIPLETAAGNVPWEGVSYGRPYQLVNENGPKTPVLDKSRPVTWDPRNGFQWPTEFLPLP